jgi:peptidylprolyl isomerase
MMRCLPLFLCACSAAAAPNRPPATAADLLANSGASDWRAPDPEQTIYMDLPAGRVVIELAPDFAPAHAANIKTLVRAHYFDGLAIVRAQDDYVVQWADPDADTPRKRPIPAAKMGLAPEFVRGIDRAQPFTPLGDADVYAPEVGFSRELPVARDPRSRTTWLAHCYGMVGVARDEPPDTGSGAELYVVIGHAPRHLDRNITLVGRVLAGVELLSTLRRGTGSLGFYTSADERTPIVRVRVAADVPASERERLELLRSDGPLFRRWLDAKRYRTEKWFVAPAGHLDLCNALVPVRTAKAGDGNR